MTVYIVLLYDMGWEVDCVFRRKSTALAFIKDRREKYPDTPFLLETKEVL